MAILAATDYSESSHAAIRYAAREAQARGEKMVLAHVVSAPVDTSSWAYFVDRARGDTGRLRNQALEKLDEVCREVLSDEERPAHCEYAVELGDPSESIHELAGEKGASLVILGGSGQRALGAYFLGSTAEDTIREGKRPVMVVPSDWQVDRCRRVLAAVDFSDCSRQSLAYAARWARFHDAELTVLHAANPSSSGATLLGLQPSQTDVEAYEGECEEKLASMIDELEVENLEVETLVRRGQPHRVVSEVVEERKMDLAVIGTHGQRGWKRFFVGSTALKILRTLPCPVITVRDEG